MPRVGNNIKRTAQGKWEVRFKEKITTMQADGTTQTIWKDRSRTFETYAAAEQFKRDQENRAAAGQRFVDQREEAVATIGTLADAYVTVAPNERTQDWRASMIKGRIKLANAVKANPRKGIEGRPAQWLDGFIAFVGADTPVTSLSAALLERFAATLPNAGRQASTRHRRTLAIEEMWAWGYESRNREKFPGVPEPARITAAFEGDVNAPVQAPAPVVRTAVATIEDVDAMRAALRSGWKFGDAHRRVALLTRYTGIRISQAVNLQWRDVFIDHPQAGSYLVLRAKLRGSKKGRSRVVPLHPALVDEMRTWGERTGSVFEGTNERWIRGEATREAFRTAWAAAGVDPAKWDVEEVDTDEDEDEDGRGRGSPTHAVRSAVFSFLVAQGVSMPIAQAVMGHKGSDATTAAYVPENLIATPHAAPTWKHLRAASNLIPDHRVTVDAPDNVVPLRANA